MTISVPLPEITFDPLMCSLADSLARTSAKPESGPELMDLARAFGLSSPVLLASFDPITWSLRTSQGSLLAEEQWGECLETLPDSGMWDAGAVYELRTLELHISESGYSSWPAMRATSGGGNRSAYPDAPYRPGLSELANNWPTARQEDGESCGNHPGAVDSLTGAAKLWGTPDSPGSGGPRNRQNSPGDGHQVTIAEQAEQKSYRDRSGTTKGEQLPNFVEHNCASPPAPQIQDGQPSSESGQTSRRLWPTPDVMASGGCKATAGTDLETQKRPDGTKAQVRLQHLTDQGKRRLNPRFVEWLMGFPTSWTER